MDNPYRSPLERAEASRRDTSRPRPSELSVTCECGRRIAVTAAQCGGSVACECGRSLDVSPLSELREQAGLAAFEFGPAQRIEGRRLEGSIELGGVCWRCDAPTTERLEAIAECERAATTHKGISLLFMIPLYVCNPIVGIFVSLLSYDRQQTTRMGRDVSARISLPICATCRPAFRNSFVKRWLPVAKWFPIATGTVLLFIVGRAGWAGIALGLAIWALDWWLRRRRQKSLRRLMRRDLLYGELLDEYPQAWIEVNE